MSFRDRREAGRLLAVALADYRAEAPVVLALPRGGVPVAAVIAEALDAPLDIVLVRKIGAPRQPELAMGAVVDGGDVIVVRNPDVIRALSISEADFDDACQRELAEIERRRTRYMAGRASTNVAGRTVIVVDDGVATGATMRAALRALRQRGAKRLVLAVPVGPADTLAEMESEADAVVCLEIPEFFAAIGNYYADFSQTSDAEVTALLDAARKRIAAEAGGTG